MKWWQPDYRIGNQIITIRGVNTAECPTSLITVQTDTLIQISSRSKWLKGINILGDASQLPAKLVDALEVLEIEESRTNDELELAVAHGRQRRGTYESDNGDCS